MYTLVHTCSLIQHRQFPSGNILYLYIPWYNTQNCASSRCEYKLHTYMRRQNRRCQRVYTSETRWNRCWRSTGVTRPPWSTRFAYLHIKCIDFLFIFLRKELTLILRTCKFRRTYIGESDSSNANDERRILRVLLSVNIAKRILSAFRFVTDIRVASSCQ